MKVRFGRPFMILLWAIAAAAVAIMIILYIGFVSEAVYTEAAGHLSEVYGQVDRNFESFLDQNWDNLEEWSDTDRYLTPEQVREVMANRQRIWGFTAYLYLDEQGNYVTVEGERGSYDLGEDAKLLFTEDQRIMQNEELADRSEVSLFALPVEPSTYDGFPYRAVGLTYTNADMVESINTDAFEERSTCLVLDTSGKVVLSTQEGANVFANYLTFLKAGSDLSEEQLALLEQAFVDQASGVIRFNMNGIGYFLSYQPVGYQDYVLIGVVQESVASKSLMEIQKANTDVLVKAFVVVAAVGVVQIVFSYRRHARRSQRAITYRDTVFDRLSANIEDIIVMLDGQTMRVDYLSPNVERLLGVPTEAVREDVRALNKTLYGGDQDVPVGVLQALPIGESIIIDRRHMHQKTGEVRWYHEHIYHQMVGDEDKYIVMMSDRTDERRLNQSLEEALETAKNANEAKSRFLSNMSHDIRTPMNAIMGFTVLLAQNADDPVRVEDYVRKISASSKHLLSLINDVLDMSKIESGSTSIHTEQFSFQETVDELYNIMAPQAHAKQQDLRFEIKGHPSELLTGDQLRVNQILINLLGNAVKYTPVGGHITFTVEELPRSSHFREDLRFIVADDGIGMSPEFVETIFDPFTREESSVTNTIQGTGLGMAITKNLVDLMGGVITVESTPGVGSTFTVDLSFGMPEDFADAGFWSDRDIYRVLVVDDDEDTCLSVQDMMRDTGVAVSYVTSGREAVDEVSREQEGPEPYSLIILDWKMPGMDGVECARQIRRAVPEDVPILVLTAYDWSDIEDEALEAGIDGFIAKPFFVTSLQQAIVGIGQESKPETVDVVGNPLDGLHILAAEDNELNAEILRERLEIEGASVVIVSNGEEAVEAVRTMEPGEYDIVLMDAQMPIMDGYEATREIRKLGTPEAERLPIIALTANVFAEDVQNAMDAGMNGHLGKPLDMDDLKVLVERLLKEHVLS